MNEAVHLNRRLNHHARPARQGRAPQEPCPPRKTPNTRRTCRRTGHRRHSIRYIESSDRRIRAQILCGDNVAFKMSMNVCNYIVEVLL